MPYTSVQKIRFDDVDGAGIVYYPQFFHLCHAAFEDFFDTSTAMSYPDLIGKERKGFPTVAISSEFVAPLRYGDVAAVTLGVSSIGKSSVLFRYAISKQGGGLCFWAEITTVLIDLDTHNPLTIADPLMGILKTLGPNPIERPKIS